MDRAEFEQRMRELEYFRSLRLLLSAWVISRVDGRSFLQFTKSHFEKPVDVEFHKLMVQTVAALFKRTPRHLRLHRKLR